MSDSTRTFRLTWLTSVPLMRGNWVAVGLGLIPGVLSVLATVATLSLDPARQGANLLAGALFFSLCTTLIQIPAFLGRVELGKETLTVISKFSGKGGRRSIPREALDEVYFSPLKRPLRVLVLAWAIVEFFFMIGAISASLGPSPETGGGGEHWYWLTGLALGLSIWPIVVARWQADQVVTLTYQRPGGKGARPHPRLGDPASGQLIGEHPAGQDRLGRAGARAR